MFDAQIQYLVFQGGGVKGIGNGGALLGLKEVKNFSLKHIKGVAGTSVGAMSALAVCLGYTEDEIGQLLRNTDYQALADGNALEEVINFYKDYGLYNGYALYDLILKIIAEKIKNVTKISPELLSFRDLKMLGFKDLHIVTSKMYLQNGVPVMKREDFSEEETPDTPIAAIVLASSAAAPYFKSVRLKKDETGTGKFVLHQDGDLYFDGGFKQNFPMDIFDKGKYVAGYPGNPEDIIVNPHTLGFALISTPLIVDEKHPPQKERVGRNHPVIFLEGLLTDVLGPVLYGEFDDKYRERTIQIDTGNIKPFDFGISKANIDLLISSGKQAVYDFFHITTPSLSGEKQSVYHHNLTYFLARNNPSHDRQGVFTQNPPSVNPC